MNGTNPDDLLEGYRTALDALADAQDALAECGPNSRDYYPQGAEAISLAQAEHWKRRGMLTAIHDEIQELAMFCMGAIDERNDRDRERDARRAQA
jgi:hypothetical protein